MRIYHLAVAVFDDEDVVEAVIFSVFFALADVFFPVGFLSFHGVLLLFHVLRSLPETRRSFIISLFLPILSQLTQLILEI